MALEMRYPASANPHHVAKNLNFSALFWLIELSPFGFIPTLIMHIISFTLINK